MKKEEWTDEELITLLRKNSDRAVELIFQKYYTFLCKTVYRVLPDANLVEDLVQEVFMELWRKHKNLKIQSSLIAYLKRSAINRTLNFIRDNKIKFEGEETLPFLKGTFTPIGAKLEAMEMREIIEQAVDQLPERCRIIFMLSRFEELSHKEIAQRLEISVKTVENQISKALKLLKKALEPYI